MIIGVNILKFIVLVLITFFTCQIVTNQKKRISYIGTLLICFSSAIIEYMDFGLIEAIVSGELIFFSVCKILEDSKLKYFYAVAIGIRNIRFFIAF